MKNILIKTLLISIPLLWSYNTYAKIECEYKKRNGVPMGPHTLNISIPDTINLDPSIRINEVFWGWPLGYETPIQANNPNLECEYPSEYRYFDAIWTTPREIIGYYGSRPIYKTNLDGVGIMMRRSIATDHRSDSTSAENGIQVPYTGRHILYSRMGVPSKPTPPGQTDVDIHLIAYGFSLVRTAERVERGRLDLGHIAQIYASQDRILIENIYASSPIIHGSATCSVTSGKNRVISLPPAPKSQFTGIGSTPVEQPFDLGILCRDISSATIEGHRVNLGFNFSQAGSNEDVILNTADDGVKANGVGLQLELLGPVTPQNVKNGIKIPIKILEDNKEHYITLPMKVKYYQTESNVTGGKVKGVATFTFRYD